MSTQARVFDKLNDDLAAAEALFRERAFPARAITQCLDGVHAICWEKEGGTWRILVFGAHGYRAHLLRASLGARVQAAAVLSHLWLACEEEETRLNDDAHAACAKVAAFIRSKAER